MTGLDGAAARAAVEDGGEQVVVGRVEVVERLHVLQELLEVVGQVLQQQPVIVLLFNLPDLMGGNGVRW